MNHPSALEDPAYAAFAWGRYKRLMAWMMGLSLLVAGLFLAFLKISTPEIPFLSLAMIFGGLMATLLLTAALMGLVFLSSGSGHDDAVIELDAVEP